MANLRCLPLLIAAFLPWASNAQIDVTETPPPTLAPTTQTRPASNLPKKILLIPVDDRPAVTQFAQMIGAIAGVQVDTPPREFLGRFLAPGSPESLLLWLRNRDLNEYDAVIVSADMVAYGGLIASRVNRSSYTLASERLRELWRIRKLSNDTPWYVFSALMRIAPTATDETRAFRTELYYWAIAKEKYRQTPNSQTLTSIRRYEQKIPKASLDDYIAARSRNVQIQTDLVRMAYHGAFNRVVFGQDDATPLGPQVPEIAAINKEVNRLKITDKASFCSGIDQISNNLISYALSDLAKYRPTVRIAYADEQGRRKVAAYETAPIEQSLRDNIVNSGAQLERAGSTFDYTLYVNTPDPAPNAFENFLTNLKLEADQGFPVAVADTNLGWTGTADPDLFAALTEERRAPRLLSYAGWNTAGNTMGTTIPAANAYLVARNVGVDPYQREVALRTFLLHRLVNDYYYHRHVRPAAFKMIEEKQDGRRDSIESPEDLAIVESFVRENMLAHLYKTFDELFKDRPFMVDRKLYRAVALKNVTVNLPWPRAFEVFIEFELDVQPVN